jgi:hypothetical protein
MHDDMLLLLQRVALGGESCFGLIVRFYYEQIITIMGPWAERAPRWSRDINVGRVWRVACRVMMFVRCSFSDFIAPQNGQSCSGAHESDSGDLTMRVPCVHFF